MNSEGNKAVIYTDGACIDNPGRGGYGVVLLCGNHRKEISAGYRLTTNNRMEIMAAIAGLRALKANCRVILYSDSRYLVEGMTRGWAKRWRSNGWKRNSKDKALNVDLWAELLDLCSTHEVEFAWVQGHAGHIENERCDQLAVKAAKGKELLVDGGYEGLKKSKE
jgi:ribonuclease HI